MQLQAAIDEHTTDLNLGRHFRQFEAGVLEVRNRLAERLALTGVLQRPLQRRFGRRQAPMATVRRSCGNSCIR
jgi:hypothetical protein